MYVLSLLRRTMLGVVAAVLLLGTVVAITATAASAAPVTVLFEDFEDADIAYSTSTPEFSDGAGDFFTRTDGSNIGTFVSVSGFNGASWFGAQDLDGEGAAATQTLTFGGLNVEGLSDLSFSALLAEDDDGTNEDWDLDDSVIVSYRIDGGPSQPILAIESVPNGTDFNAVPAVDTDFDGNGDGTEITSSFANFSAAIPETGSVLELTITIALNAGDEDIAIDDVLVVGEGTPVGPIDPVINEVGFSDASTDNEFVEIFGGAGVDYSGYTILQVDGDVANAGEIDSVNAVGTTDATGIWAALVAANELENGDTTFLLVEGFTGSDNDDLDTDDDGTFDVTPWIRVVDSVSINDGGGLFYGVPVLDESFDDARLPANGFAPGGLSRIPDGADTDAAADWYRNDFDWDGTTNGSPEVGEALNTPGAPNEVVVAPLPVVFVAELHYDNDGGDVGEFVEVQGDAGTDLTGWSLELYNGNGGGSYRTEPLSGVIDDEEAGQGALSFLVAGLQNGAPDGLALVAPDGTVVEFLSYEGSFQAVGGPADGLTSTDIGVSEPGSTPIGQSLQLIDGVWTGPAAESPGVLNGDGGDPNPPTVALISAVQGAGPSVAITTPVTVEAVVTSLFTRDDVLDGFFVQEQDADIDADPATSEGIFVFCRGVCLDSLAVGDAVTVTGTPGEFFGMSQINVQSGTVIIDSSANPLPSATAITLPAAGRTDAEATFEAVEGMLVTFPDTLVVSEYFQLARFGQVVLTDESRPRQFTDANDPSAVGYAAFLEDLASRRIILDDDNNDQNDAIFDTAPDEPYPWPVGGFSTTNFFRGGDTIAGMTGVLHWSFAGAANTNAWRVRPVDGIDNTFESANPRPAEPLDVGGTMTVASFNVLNYFTTLDENGNLCGPSSLECRGADSLAELDRQRAKIVDALLAIDASVVGLIEIENDDDSSVNDLVGALNTVLGPDTYAAIETGAIGGDAIKVALIYQPSVVSPVGSFAVLDSGIDPRFIDDKNRPVLIQTFEENASGAQVTIAVNHLKSKGSDCDALGDPDANDGQGNCNLTRADAAQALADYLATDPTGTGAENVLIIGDLNAYANEDPITRLEAAGYTDLLEAQAGTGAYTFVFDGQLGYLDYALANDTLLPFVTGTTVWNINADEVNILDYNDDVRDSTEASFERESSALDLFDPDAFRSSDHDPVIVGLALAEPVPTCGGLPATIVGTDADEVIQGTQGDDVILALGGDDFVLGLGGDDTICGGEGDDALFGQIGNDRLFGEQGDDRLFGQSGDDELDGGAGRDALTGNAGTDVCVNGETVRSCRAV